MLSCLPICGNIYAVRKMIKILFEDKHITICEKLPGQNSEKCESADSLPKLLEEQLHHEIFPLHRLDKPVGGAIMFANNKNTASVFSRLITENGVTKKYVAVIDGSPSEKEGELRDYLFRDSRKNKTFVVKRMRKGVKEASLKYKVIAECDSKTLVEIELITGRTHQIRAQFASRKTPVTGDGKYGSKCNKCEAALWSYSLSFVNPINNSENNIVCIPPIDTYPWNLFDTYFKT